MKAWITYAYEDSEFAEKLKTFLAKDDFEVLDVENKILPGDNIVEAIYKAISESNVIFVILSKSSNSKQWFSTEIGLIISEIRKHSEKKLIPILKDKDAIIPPFINQYQFLDVSESKNIDLQFEKLLLVLNDKKVSHIDKREVDLRANDVLITRSYLLEKEMQQYEKEQKQKQKQISLVFLTTIFATLLGLLSIFPLAKDLFKFDFKTPYTAILTGLAGVFIGIIVNIILNQLKKK